MKASSCAPPSRASTAQATQRRSREKVLGFRLPLLGLGDWMRARPSPGLPAVTQYNDNGSLKLLEQRGWRIEYLEYDGARPRLLRLAYPGIELRFAVSEWK